ncbi:FHA domain-containing protein [Candidatus Nitrotoga sp. M5]|uniref:FHA domain-containing protein n=1 Tax=Candidatus Nitrotoga sp. M5 TaxID=2890409 RepID=UPI001EF17317|nr:FHA domain-containing protein [Candidatus Nitrotoga sp. M5]CAH1385984.1 FHA domain-containing protein [Candidatus Nitrotoga sp. M5]
MAAKLILSMNGGVLREYALDKERMTIGRKPHCDIVIDNLAVSGEHAAIVTILNDSFLEDLDSTNGTSVNGTAIKRHFLQNNDVIEIGKYILKYLNDQKIQSTAADFEKTMVFRKSARIATPSLKADPYEMTGKVMSTEQPQLALAEKVSDSQQKIGVIQILIGPNAGKELELVKSLTTVGKAGLQVVVFTRRPSGYFITHVEGASYPNRNGKPLDDQPCQLNEHDIIELAGVKMEFYLKS